MKPLPKLDYTKDARRDFDRCRQFLRRRSAGNVRQLTRKIMNAVRRIRENPEMSPVRKLAPDTGLPLRRYNVAQFVIVYVYFRPDPLEPNGLVSIRAFRHASEADALWAVREWRSGTALTPEWFFLSTRIRPPFAACQPLSTYGEITFVPNDPGTG